MHRKIKPTVGMMRRDANPPRIVPGRAHCIKTGHVTSMTAAPLSHHANIYIRDDLFNLKATRFCRDIDVRRLINISKLTLPTVGNINIPITISRRQHSVIKTAFVDSTPRIARKTSACPKDLIILTLRKNLGIGACCDPHVPRHTTHFPSLSTIPEPHSVSPKS